ncbi:hypothetical protein HanRHA438_Chr15g0687531 [Helianthus annuus]|nr:hypothetical protein HanRHA438_Chr15g0687531 [Helianthus annuus]
MGLVFWIIYEYALLVLVIYAKSELPIWSLWFEHFCYFSPNLKLITSESLWFAFCCHFSPNLKISEL